MSAPMCGDCLVPLNECAHAVEYITQRNAIKTLRKVNRVMSELFNMEEEDNETSKLL
jgi:hypothetical protein